MFRLRNRLPQWLALLALLMYTLMPAISGLNTSARFNLVQEICTPGGLQIKGALNVPGKPALAASDHCPWCLAGSHASLPTAAGLPLLAAAGGSPLVVALPRVFGPPPVVAWAAPRGPPSPV